MQEVRLKGDGWEVVESRGVPSWRPRWQRSHELALEHPDADGVLRVRVGWQNETERAELREVWFPAGRPSPALRDLARRLLRDRSALADLLACAGLDLEDMRMQGRPPKQRPPTVELLGIVVDEWGDLIRKGERKPRKVLADRHGVSANSIDKWRAHAIREGLAERVDSESVSTSHGGHYRGRRGGLVRTAFGEAVSSGEEPDPELRGGDHVAAARYLESRFPIDDVTTSCRSIETIEDVEEMLDLDRALCGSSMLPAPERAAQFLAAMTTILRHC